jgi:hypothetical protein
MNTIAGAVLLAAGILTNAAFSWVLAVVGAWLLIFGDDE